MELHAPPAGAGSPDGSARRAFYPPAENGLMENRSGRTCHGRIKAALARLTPSQTSGAINFQTGVDPCLTGRS